MNVVAIIPAAGSGVRMQHANKKPYIELGGRTLLGHTLIALNRAPSITSIVIAVAPGDEDFCRDQVVSGLELHTSIIIVAGGERRQDSVANALEVVPAACDVVVVHDGARPFITPEIVEDTASAAQQFGAATAAMPVKDTIMQLDVAESTDPTPLERNTLYAIQTPQAFRPDIIRAAHVHAQRSAVQATDDASLVRHMGLPVAITAGSYENIKITTAGDLVHASAIMRTREG